MTSSPFFFNYFSKVISCKKDIRGVTTRLVQAKRKLVERQEELKEVGLYLLTVKYFFKLLFLFRDPHLTPSDSRTLLKLKTFPIDTRKLAEKSRT